MGKYFITGRPGTGKSSVIRNLQNRGFTAYNTDELDDVTKLENGQTGEVVPWPDSPVDWGRYRWNWQEAELKKLLASSGTVFVGAIVGNQEQYLSLFDKVFVLIIDSASLEQRLKQHEHNRTSEENARILLNHETKQELLIKHGLIPLSSAEPLDKVVDKILMSIGVI
jgi:broad-specificity NMP kinase